MVRGGDGSNAQRNEEEEGDLMVLSQKGGLGRVWLMELRVILVI